MDRCAVFVDAGYVLAEGGRLCLGTRRRVEISCLYADLLRQLALESSRHCQLQVLRTYWYDAAPNGLPTAEHLQIAALRNVKLRLGRLSGMRQKGVDALIYRDLMTLARERAMVVAFLVSGDEDLREGVIAAQDMGVQVVLVGVPAREGSNQAQTLVHEADEHLVLDEGFWRQYFKHTGRPEEGLARGDGRADGRVPVDPASAGEEFARQWARRAPPDELRELLRLYPRIPSKLDIELLLGAEARLGPLRANDPAKRQVRAGFWSTLRTLSERGELGNP